MAAPTLDSTAKGASANSYATRAGCQTYMDGRMDADEWQTGGATLQDRSLIMATSRLEQEQYAGSKTTTTQRLKWPRFSTYNDNGDSYDVDVVPRPILEATYELALALLKAPELIANTGLESFKNVGIGSGAVDVTPRESFKAGTLPQAVKDILSTGSVWTSKSGVSGSAVRG